MFLCVSVFVCERVCVYESVCLCVCVRCCVSNETPFMLLTRGDSDYNTGGYAQPSETPG